MSQDIHPTPDSIAALEPRVPMASEVGWMSCEGQSLLHYKTYSFRGERETSLLCMVGSGER